MRQNAARPWKRFWVDLMTKRAQSEALKVTLVRSVHGRLSKHKACVRGLGLRRLHQSVEIENTPCNRGMIKKVAYLLQVEGGSIE